MLLDCACDGVRFAVCCRVVTPHYSLQLRKLADHTGKQITFRKSSCAVNVVAVHIEFRGQPGSQCPYALCSVEQTAKTVLINDFIECILTTGEDVASIGVPEKRCVGEPRANDTLVTAADLPGILAVEICNGDEVWQQIAFGVGYWEVTLMTGQCGDHNFAWQTEILAVEIAQQRHRPLDQRSNLVIE